MADLYDVTVRIPVEFTSPAEASGFIHACVEEGMSKAGFVGGAAVLWRDENGAMQMFHEGLCTPGTFVLPHGLDDSALVHEGD